MNFEAFSDDIRKNGWNIFGVELYEQGKLTHSYGDTTEEIHDLYSATKSIVSIAAGIVYDRGLVDFDKSILEYLPADKVSKISSEQKKTWGQITVKRLMSMSVEDLPFAHEGDSYIDFCLNQKLENPEKRGFNYSNLNSYLVGVALTEILGEDLGAFIEKNLFEPLEIKKFNYKRCPEGYFYGSTGMNLTVHDFSKIGCLVYDGGVFEGKRIVSEEYVKMATSVRQMNREGGYGFFFWKYKDGFSLNGKLGQKCYCRPEKGLMLTFLSNMDEGFNDVMSSVGKNIWDEE